MTESRKHQALRELAKLIARKAMRKGLTPPEPKTPTKPGNRGPRR